MRERDGCPASWRISKIRCPSSSDFAPASSFLIRFLCAEKGGEKAPGAAFPGGILAPARRRSPSDQLKMGPARLRTDPEGLTEKLLRR